MRYSLKYKRLYNRLKLKEQEERFWTSGDYITVKCLRKILEVEDSEDPSHAAYAWFSAKEERFPTAEELDEYETEGVDVEISTYNIAKALLDLIDNEKEQAEIYTAWEDICYGGLNRFLKKYNVDGENATVDATDIYYAARYVASKQIEAYYKRIGKRNYSYSCSNIDETFGLEELSKQILRDYKRKCKKIINNFLSEELKKQKKVINMRRNSLRFKDLYKRPVIRRKLRRLKEQEGKHTYLVTGYITADIRYQVESNLIIDIKHFGSFINSETFPVTVEETETVELPFEVEIKASSPEEAEDKVKEEIYVDCEGEDKSVGIIKLDFNVVVESVELIE